MVTPLTLSGLPVRWVRAVPCPPYCMAHSMEVLAANVRCHPDITGLHLPDLSSPPVRAVLIC